MLNDFIFFVYNGVLEKQESLMKFKICVVCDVVVEIGDYMFVRCNDVFFQVGYVYVVMVEICYYEYYVMEVFLGVYYVVGVVDYYDVICVVSGVLCGLFFQKRKQFFLKFLVFV